MKPGNYCIFLIKNLEKHKRRYGIGGSSFFSNGEMGIEGSRGTQGKNASPS